MQDMREDTGYELQSELHKTIAEIRSQSADVSGLMAALAVAQGQFPDIERDRKVKVASRSGGGYEFKYATLGSIIKGIKKVLSTNGIAHTQVVGFEPQENRYYLTTSLFCGNQFISSVVPLILNEGTNQAFGSALTYMKRYTLAALVGVAPDEDDDGNLADGNEVKEMAEAIKETFKPKAPAPDVMSDTNPPTGRIISNAPDPVAVEIATNRSSFTTLSPESEDYISNEVKKIDVPLLPDESASDWMVWGQLFMKQARAAKAPSELDALKTANEVPLKNMEIHAPKMFANLSVALVNTRRKMERKDAAE